MVLGLVFVLSFARVYDTKLVYIHTPGERERERERESVYYYYSLVKGKEEEE